MRYRLTSQWHNDCPDFWEEAIEEHLLFNNRRLLELGTHEGASLIQWVERCGIRDITCVDVWEDEGFFQRFLDNSDLLLETYKDLNLTYHVQTTFEYLKNCREGFDIIYVDASHYPQHVILDATLAFKCLNYGGLIIFDDYKWTRIENGMTEPDKSPKPGIDAFETTHRRFLEPIACHPNQRAFRKIAFDKDFVRF